MPKQIVIEPCLINFGDDRGGVGHAAGEIVEVSKETAAKLAGAGRTLYVDKKDDPDKHARYTASKEMIKAAEQMAAEKARAAKANTEPAK
jgi:hypothetical protein